MSAVTDLLAQLDGVGRDPRGGWTRPGFGREVRLMQAWFTTTAEEVGLDVRPDRNGNLWAWWGAPGLGAVVTGSHLDSVPGGGRLDGPLGVASALVAVGRLRAAGFRPQRPVAVVAFAEEEGSRFGVACLGSRLLAGRIDPDAVRALRDDDGVPFAEVATRAGLDPDGIGEDAAALARIGALVELHVEQGRGLADLDAPVAIASTVMAHGRWRLELSGAGDHAGATPMAGRRDPVVAAARVVLAVRDAAAALPSARATVGRIDAVPGATNAIASAATLWIDARDPDERVLDDLVATIHAAADAAADAEGCTARLEEESRSPAVVFDPALRARLTALLPGAPELATGAGHDAAVLAARVPTAMLFVRNPTGTSHAPGESASSADMDAGVDALGTVLADLAA